MAAVKASLGAHYGCDTALIVFPNPCAMRRKRALATLTLDLTIAEESTAGDGTQVLVSIGALLAAVQAVSDADLSAALTLALGVTISVSASTAPAQAMVEKTVEFVCPKGKWWCA